MASHSPGVDFADHSGHAQIAIDETSATPDAFQEIPMSGNTSAAAAVLMLAFGSFSEAPRRCRRTNNFAGASDSGARTLFSMFPRQTKRVGGQVSKTHWCLLMTRITISQ
jgi:hypothetical protein